MTIAGAGPKEETRRRIEFTGKSHDELLDKTGERVT